MPGFGTEVRRGLALAASFAMLTAAARADDKWIVYEGGNGPGQGKNIVFMAGDEEYRSEEGLPQLAKILAVRHGFRCTVLFSQTPDGVVDPNESTNIPGMHLLEAADLVFVQFRFRRPPDEDMKRFEDYMRSGKPIVAIRTSTHAFAYPKDSTSPFAKYSWDSAAWPGGFGQQVLGDTWVDHHGIHGKESARGLIDGMAFKHPVLRGVKDVWGPSDVYGIRRLKPEDTVLLHGLTLRGMEPDSPPNCDKALMPIVWIRDYAWDNGKTTRALTSTIGAAVDLKSEDLRRMFVNAAYWLTGLDVPDRANADTVGPFEPTMFGFNTFQKGVPVSSHKLPLANSFLEALK